MVDSVSAFRRLARLKMKQENIPVDANRPLANHTCFIMNKFQHVQRVGPGLGVRGQRVGLGASLVQWGPIWTRLNMPGVGGFLYGEVQCIIGNGQWDLMWTNRPTDMTENITLPQLRWRMVKTSTGSECCVANNVNCK